MSGISQKGATKSPPAVPTKVLSETGNKFLRVTTSLGDGADSTPVKGRIRNQLSVHAAKPEPLIESNANGRGYSYDFRYHGTGNGFSGITMQLFQNGPYNGYGQPGSYGPAAWSFRKQDGSVVIENRYGNDKIDAVNVGRVLNNTWHNIKILAVWSHNPSKATLEFYFDNKLVKKITGRDICKGPLSNTLPHMDIGAYGGDENNSLAGKSVDFDNIKVWEWSGGGNDTPPAAPKVPRAPPGLEVR